MTPTLDTVDRAVVHDSFRQWQEDQSLLDAQLADSVAALEAYQSHLDTWQQELAREREEIRQLRQAIERDQVGGGAQREQIECLNRELGDARKQVTSLAASLLARTEELRELDHKRAAAATELVAAQARERELAKSLASQQENLDAQRQRWESETAKLREELQLAFEAAADANANVQSLRSGAAKTETRSASPVLGSVMEQFGKLRQQRSLNRPNPKTR